jgi:acyl-CoA reductase-like NAD-dependent aldehyde dehydrogenase
MGQPITLAKRMILGPAATWRYYAGYAGKVAGESYPPDEDGTYKIVQYEPLGKWIFSPDLAVGKSLFENLHPFIV